METFKKSFKYFLLFFIALALGVYFIFVKSESEPIELEGLAQGTSYHIHFAAPKISPTEIKQLDQEIITEFQRLDKSISNYRPDSDIEKINAQQNTESIETSEEIIALIEIARKVSVASHGCYDLTIKPLWDLWGFKADQFHFPTDIELKNALALRGMEKIITLNKTHLQKMNADIRIDLSSIGQGYSVSQISHILDSHKIENYMIEIGGELKVKGAKPNHQAWRVALEKPISTERKIEKIITFNSINPMSLMPSGTYHHFFNENGKRYSHILDARTGKPIEHNTVMANAFLADSTQADAWSTALLCMGSDEGLKVANENNIAALFIDQYKNKNGDEEFIEIKSDALKAMTWLMFEDPESSGH